MGEKANQTRTKFIPPRGIRLFKRDRLRGWCVQWREPGESKVTTRGFDSEKGQIKFARELARKREAVGLGVLSFDPVKWQRFLFFEAQLGGIDNFPEVVRVWNESGRGPSGGEAAGAVGRFLLEKERQGVSRDTYQRYDRLLALFAGDFGGRDLGEITADELVRWIDGQRWRGQPFDACTKNNWRTLLRAFFQASVRRRELGYNPLDEVARWGLVQKPVGILTPEEGRRLFEVNRDAVFIGRLALEAFAGLRYSSAKRLRLADLNFEDRGIVLPANMLKTARRVYVDGFPDVLWEWLERAPAACWELTERQYQRLKGAAFAQAGVPWPDNCLRHSFCTYHIAKYKNVGLTATLLCHSNLKMLTRHYRGNATSSEGVAWFEIGPGKS